MIPIPEFKKREVVMIDERKKGFYRILNIPSVLKWITAVFSLTTIAAQVQALTPDQVFNKVKDSIVVVKTLDANGNVKCQGSGVLLPSGKIATNRHVVEDGTSYQVGRGKELVRASIYAEDVDKDTCLLDAAGLTGKPAQIGKATDLKIGVPVYAVGAPQGLELSLSNGIVSQLRGGPPPFIQTTAAISPGSSGGGLFDREGRLVGLTTLYIKGGQSLNFAMPVEWIDELKPSPKTITNNLPQTEWIKRAAAFEKLEDWWGMLDCCQKWTKSEPKNATAWYNIGVAYDNIGLTIHTIHALDAFQQAIHINPEDYKPWYNLGCIYNRLNRHDDAIDAYRQAIRIDPEFSLAWNNLGVTYLISGNRTAALDAAKELRRLDPERADELYNTILSQQTDTNHRQPKVSSHPSLHLRNGVIEIGMTREMVLLALGNPDDVQRSGDFSGVRETWVYYAPLPEIDPSSLVGLTTTDIMSLYLIAQSKRKATFLFFSGGVLTSFREQ